MTRYLDIGVVRIQGYLTRAPHLKSRRGASTMISDASRAARAACPDGTAVNAEAGAVDGVVSLTVDDGTGQAAATQVLTRLRTALPAADLRAAVWEGTTYTAARDGATIWEQDWLPAVPEWPLAKTCDWCRTWPATPKDHHVDSATENYCTDCALRSANAGAAHSAKRAPGPERDLLERLPGATVPDDFDALARLGGQADNTHIVTIYADGNGIGDYMKKQNHRPDLAAEIHEATWTAVETMVAALTRSEPGPLPLVPHLIGGDDVLVSLPAHDMWPGLRSLLAGFGDRFPGQNGPTLSAGVVVHHRKQPLSDVVDLASDLLRAAKRTHPDQAAFAWHSVTHDGAVPTGRPALRVDTLNETWQALTSLHAQPASARQQLGRLLRDPDPAALKGHIKRLGLTPVVEPFTKPGGIPLDDALGMLRWWSA